MTRKILIGLGAIGWAIAMGIAVASAQTCVDGQCDPSERMSYSDARDLQLQTKSGVRRLIKETEYAQFSSMVKVRTDDGGGVSSLGSGVITLYNGVPIILTSWHVIKDARSTSVLDLNARLHKAVLLGHDKSWDIAVLYAKTIALSQAVAYSTTPLILQQPVGLYGYGDGPIRRLSRVVSYIVGFQAPQPSGPLDWASTNYGQAQNGDSGGAVLNARGQLVGVRWGGDQNTTVFVKMPRILNLLKFLGVGPNCSWYRPPPVTHATVIRGPPLTYQSPISNPSFGVVEKSVEELSIDMTSINASMNKQATAIAGLTNVMAQHYQLQTQLLQIQINERKVAADRERSEVIIGVAQPAIESAIAGVKEGGVMGGVAAVITNPGLQEAASNVLLYWLAAIPGIGWLLFAAGKLGLPLVLRMAGNMVAGWLYSPKRTPAGDVIRAGLQVADKQRAREAKGGGEE